jgi:hypothetical protein
MEKKFVPPEKEKIRELSQDRTYRYIPYYQVGKQTELEL